MESKHIDANGIAMRWNEEGEGRPVVFIHGLPTSPALWRHVAPQVQKARCLAWEMSGYGASIEEGRERDLSVDRQTDYLISWMDALGIDGAVLVGHDLGGGVAQIAAVRYPERVKGLVLMNSICYDSWPVPGVKLIRTLGPVVRLLPDAIFYYVFSMFLHQGHDDQGRARASILAHWPHYTRADGAAAFVRQVNALDVRDTLAVADELSNLNLPARLIWGAADQFQKVEYGERLAQDLDAPLERIEGALHFVPEDHPHAVADAVNALLEEMSTPIE